MAKVPRAFRGRRGGAPGIGVMRALLCANPGELRIVERPKPAIAEGQLQVRLRRAGV